jgi:hypothetical protein
LEPSNFDEQVESPNFDEQVVSSNFDEQAEQNLLETENVDEEFLAEFAGNGYPCSGNVIVGYDTSNGLSADNFQVYLQVFV